MSFIPTGLTPARKLHAGRDNGGLRPYVLDNTTPEDLYHGAPVIMNSGDLEVAAAGENPIGVFVSAEYVDNTTKRPRYANHVPAGTVGTAGNPIVAMVAVDPQETFYIQANDAVTDSDVGNLYALTDIATGDDITGQSDAVVDVASGTVALAASHVEILAVVPQPGNPSATPIVEVRLTNHAYA